MTMGRSALGRFPLATDPTGAFGTHLTMDYALPIENAGTQLKREGASPLSWPTALFRDGSAPLSWTAGVILGIDAALPLEYSTHIRHNNALPLAFLQGVVIPADSALPLAFTAILPVDFALPLAFEGTPFILGEVLRPATPTYMLVPQRPRGI